MMERQPDEQLEIPHPDGPIIYFVLNGIKLSVQQNILTKREAIAQVKQWYPEAEISDIGSELSEAISKV